MKETSLKKVKSKIGSITNKNLLQKVVYGMDYIIHVAAVTSIIEFEKRTYEPYKTNVLGFNNVIESAIIPFINLFLALIF